VLLAAAGVTAFAAGDLYYTVMTVGGGSLPYPSLADVGYLLFYPLMLAALSVTVRRHQRGFASWVSLDAAVGSLGAAAVLAVLLRPVLDSTTVGLGSLATMVALAYPMFDVLLLAAVAGIAAMGQVRTGSRWGLLAAGLMVFAAADVIYALRVHALPGECRELSEFAVVREPESEAGRGDAKLVGGPESVDHAPHCSLRLADGANDLSLIGFESESRCRSTTESHRRHSGWRAKNTGSRPGRSGAPRSVHVKPVATNAASTSPRARKPSVESEVSTSRLEANTHVQRILTNGPIT